MDYIGRKITISLACVLAISCRGESQQKEVYMNRKPHVAGQFYPAGKEQLQYMVDSLLAVTTSGGAGGDVRVVVSPHAGYVYSGQVAASAFAQVDGNVQYERVFVIASSHVAAFDAVSVYNLGNYLTPLGEVPVDTALASELISENDFMTCNREADQAEHSIEVQLPFMQRRLRPGYKLVPLIVGTADTGVIASLARVLEPYFNEKNLFVVSTDFSHYPGYADAARVDAQTADAICSNKPASLLASMKSHQGESVEGLVTSLCGWTSMLTLMYITEGRRDVRYTSVAYASSGDSPAGNKNRVVGYNAMVVTQPGAVAAFSLSQEEEDVLLRLAREAIGQHLSSRTTFQPDTIALTSNLRHHCGAFVSLHAGGNLRGCIGRFSADEPLWQLVVDMAIASAMHDSRFIPVTLQELGGLEIEISVLTPLERVSDPGQIELGRHGIYIRKGNHSGTFLPQVASQTGWDLEQFLGHCARDKAGIGWEGWKDAELYTYEAIVFKEK